MRTDLALSIFFLVGFMMLVAGVRSVLFNLMPPRQWQAVYACVWSVCDNRLLCSGVVGLCTAEVLSEVTGIFSSIKAGIIVAVILHRWEEVLCTCIGWYISMHCAVMRLPRATRCIPPALLYAFLLHALPDCFREQPWQLFAKSICSFLLSKLSTRVFCIHVLQCRLATVLVVSMINAAWQGPCFAVLFAVLLTRCPHSWLWWPRSAAWFEECAKLLETWCTTNSHEPSRSTRAHETETKVADYLKTRDQTVTQKQKD